MTIEYALASRYVALSQSNTHLLVGTWLCRDPTTFTYRQLAGWCCVASGRGWCKFQRRGGGCFPCRRSLYFSRLGSSPLLPCGARAFVSALLCSTGEHESEPKGVRCSPFCGSVVVRGCLMFLFVLERDYLGAVVLSRELRMAVLWSWACTQGQPDQGASTVLRFVYWSGLEGKLLVVQPRRAPRWGLPFPPLWLTRPESNYSPESTMAPSGSGVSSSDTTQ